MDSVTFEKFSKREVYLDVLKIISAFFIIFYHFGRLNFGEIVNGTYIPNAERVIENITVVSIPIFFMVNGALIFQKRYTVEQIYTKAAKIALLIFVWEFTGFPSWFFKTLIVLYLLYPVLLKIYENKGLRLLVSLFILIMPFLYNFVIVVLMRFFPEFSIKLFGHIISLDTIPNRTGLFTMYSILYLFIGAYLSQHSIKAYFSIPLLILGIAVVTWDGVVMTNYHGEIYDSVNGCFQTVGALIAGIGFFSLIKSIKFSDKISGFTSFLGSRVLYTYLFHVLFIHQIIWKYILTEKHYSVIVVFLVSIIIYVASMLVGMILEKIPLIKYLVKM